MIRPKGSGHEITCYFAPGSEVKGCRIVLISERRDCELHTTATRQEGAGDAVVNVTLPAGEYSVVVYDDELVTEENPAFSTTLSVTGTTVAGICTIAAVYKHWSTKYFTSFYGIADIGCVFDQLDDSKSTSGSKDNSRSIHIFSMIIYLFRQ